MVGFLLDTNVVSELVRPTPEARVVDWVAAQSAPDLFIAAVSLGELVRGVSRMPSGRRRARLARWVEVDLAARFAGRVLPFDRDAAVIWGNLMGTGDRAGRPPAAIDAQLAAIALQNDLVLATRNTADFALLEIRTFDPWR